VTRPPTLSLPLSLPFNLPLLFLSLSLSLSLSPSLSFALSSAAALEVRAMSPATSACPPNSVAILPGSATFLPSRKDDPVCPTGTSVVRCTRSSNGIASNGNRCSGRYRDAGMRTRSSRVALLGETHGEKTSASRARTGVVRSCANRECYATRESLRQEGACSRSPEGRDAGADGAEERTRGLRERGREIEIKREREREREREHGRRGHGARGAGISPWGSVTNSIRRGRGKETGGTTSAGRRGAE